MKPDHNKFNGRLTVTVFQLAEMTGLNRWSIYHLVSQRRIPHVKIGRRVLFPVEDIREWIRERTVAPTSE